jgi:hypothetical protein
MEIISLPVADPDVNKDAPEYDNDNAWAAKCVTCDKILIVPTYPLTGLRPKVKLGRLADYMLPSDRDLDFDNLYATIHVVKRTPPVEKAQVVPRKTIKNTVAPPRPEEGRTEEVVQAEVFEKQLKWLRTNRDVEDDKKAIDWYRLALTVSKSDNVKSETFAAATGFKKNKFATTLAPAASAYLSDKTVMRYRQIARREREQVVREFHQEKNTTKFMKPGRTTRVKGFEPDVLDHKSTGLARQHCFTALTGKEYSARSLIYVGADFIRENARLINIVNEHKQPVKYFAINPLNTTHDHLARLRAEDSGFTLVAQWKDLDDIPRPAIILCSNSAYYCSKYIAETVRPGDQVVVTGHIYDHESSFGANCFHARARCRLTEYTVDV